MPPCFCALNHAKKVNYFWGGKSLVIGWDSRWGTLQVWASGGPTTGTYRPYGMDCSGFMVFAKLLEYIEVCFAVELVHHSSSM